MLESCQKEEEEEKRVWGERGRTKIKVGETTR